MGQSGTLAAIVVCRPLDGPLAVDYDLGQAVKISVSLNDKRTSDNEGSDRHYVESWTVVFAKGILEGWHYIRHQNKVHKSGAGIFFRETGFGFGDVKIIFSPLSQFSDARYDGCSMHIPRSKDVRKRHESGLGVPVVWIVSFQDFVNLFVGIDEISMGPLGQIFVKLAEVKIRRDGDPHGSHHINAMDSAITGGGKDGESWTSVWPSKHTEAVGWMKPICLRNRTVLLRRVTGNIDGLAVRLSSSSTSISHVEVVPKLSARGRILSSSTFRGRNSCKSPFLCRPHAYSMWTPDPKAANYCSA
ncbi:hypothetical protein BDD12DRAFT_803746 [Trichophaea hybrida]|nr:hypothetical protein BDD12DRAFT_803746 [Trichophaea hybrida]